VSQTRTHAAAHELTGLTTGGTTSPLGYDPKGNLLSRPAALASPALGLVWDFDNRLRGADTNGTPASQEVSFEYDALGRRVARSETGSSIVYVHAGQQVIADYARGAAAAAPSFRYVYGSYVDEPLLRHAGTGTALPTSGTAALYYHRNQQYSIVGLSDAAGTLVERYAYTAYGELTILAPNRTLRATSSFQNRYTYTGREWDAGLSLYYFRARWLEPKAGRFIGRDPLGYVDGMGLYGAYLGLSEVDPTGKIKVEPFGERKNGSCGGESSHSWNFTLENEYQEAGWIVQRVSVKCARGDCKKWDIRKKQAKGKPEKSEDCCVCETGEYDYFEYFEAWYVAAKESRPEMKRIGSKKETHDIAKYKIPNGNCGETKQHGELRFFPESVTGNLAAIDSGWLRNQIFGLWSKCPTTSKDLLGFDGGHGTKKPTFWDSGKHLETGVRALEISYQCCTCKDKWVISWGEP
jgi:RHS repeat-associated protein